MIKKYKALKTIAFSGSVYRIGEVFEMEEAEARNIGLGDYLQEIEMSDEETKAPEAAPAEEATPEPAPEPTPAPEAAPAEENQADGS